MANINLTIQIEHPAAASNTVRYARIDNTLTPVYTIIPNVQGPVFVISNVPNGQYRVYARPNYPDGRACVESVFTTPACSGITLFSATYDGVNFIIQFQAIADVPKVQINISFPNGGVYTAQYDNVPGDIIIAPPTGVFGDFSVSIQPVCDSDSGFLGPQVGPTVLTVSPPNNSTIENQTASGALAPLSLTLFGPGGTTLAFSTASLDIGVPQGLYIPDGFYTSIVASFTGVAFSGSLTTGTGVTTGTGGTSTVTFFNVNMSGGATIILTEPT